jgi:hypothetical protein
MKKFFGAAVLFAMPALVFAAGFAKQSIFLSTTVPVEGQTVLIYASVTNPTTAKFTGTLEVKDESGKIGTADVSLAAGSADSVSVSWKPTAGSHTVTATLKDSTGTAVEENSETFSIASKNTANASTNTSTAGVEPSTGIQESIGNLSPAAQQYSAPVFRMIDSGRVFAAGELNKAIDWSKQQIGAPSKKATPFVNTSQPEKSGAAHTAWTILATVVLYVLSVLLYVIGHAGVFYPVLAVIFFYILWRCWRRYRR